MSSGSSWPTLSLLLPNRLQKLLQAQMRPVESRLHGTERALQRLRDLVVRQALEVPQHDDRPQLGAQPPQGNLNFPFQMVVFGPLAERVATVSDLFLGRLCRSGLRKQRGSC